MDNAQISEKTFFVPIGVGEYLLTIAYIEQGTSEMTISRDTPN